MFGFEIRRADQSIITDSNHPGGVFLETLTIPGGQSGSKVYPESVGNSLYFIVLLSGRHNLTVDSTGLGEGRLNWTNYGTDSTTTVAVFTKKLTSTSGFGMVLKNESDEVVAVFSHSVPQFLGTVQPEAVPIESAIMPSGGYKHRHSVNVPAVGSADMVVMIMCAIPDGDGTAWYSWTPWIFGTGGSVEVTVHSESGNSYEVPTLTLYSVNKPPTDTEAFGIKMYKANGELAYVSHEKNLVTESEFSFSFPARGATNAYTVNMPAKAGIIMPNFGILELTANARDKEYAGVVRRVGSQLTFKTILTKDDPAEPGVPGYLIEYGNKLSNFGIVVNLAPYGAGGVTTTQTPPVITQHPMSVMVNVGQNATFTIAATGNPVPQYRWYRNNVLIAGATAASYTKVAEADDNGVTFRCEAYNTLASVSSNGATLSLNAPYEAAYITANPSSTSVTEGDYAYFSVGAAGTAPLSYQWYENGVPISGATSSSYVVYSTLGMNGWQYYCRISNTAPGGAVNAVNSGLATLYVSSITPTENAYITQHPSSVQAYTGNYVTFSVSAGGTGPFSYQWFFNGSSMPGQNGYSLGVVAGSGTVGNYYCVVSGATNIVVFSNSASLSLYAPPVITSQPQSRFITVGQSGAMSFGVTGATSYTWYRRASEGGFLYYGTGSSINPSTSTVGTWEFYCEACNSVSCITSDIAILSVTAATPEPSIFSQPQGATVDQNAYHIIGVSATNTTRYQWYRDGSPFGSDSASLVVSTSSTGSSTYFCRCYNGLTVYTDSSSCTITVVANNQSPQIITYPVGGQVAVNSSKTLSTTVRYADNVQWFRDDVHVGGTVATGETFTSTKVVPTNVAGTYVYRMRVTHINGNYLEYTVVVTVGTPQ